MDMLAVALIGVAAFVCVVTIAVVARVLRRKRTLDERLLDAEAEQRQQAIMMDFAAKHPVDMMDKVMRDRR